MNLKGFTLIELLVTIVIVGILAAMSIQLFGQYRQRAHNSKARATLQELMLAATTVCDDWEAGRVSFSGLAPSCSFGSRWTTPVCRHGATALQPLVSDATENSPEVSALVAFPASSFQGLNPRCDFSIISYDSIFKRSIPTYHRTASEALYG